MLWTDPSSLMRRVVIGMAAFSAFQLSPAVAADTPTTRLVSCGEESCLLVSGNRDDLTAQVAINDRVVAVEGGRNWRARVPVDTLRTWSAPFAQTIMVSVAGVPTKARLPIGMFLGSEHVAMLTITAK